MAKLAAVVARAARTAATNAAASDRDLLMRYAASGDEAAFAAVVGRHTGMVLGVCRRVLHNPADAEDACQAVFLVLARKVTAVRWQASAANWLYATARRVANNARIASSRRARREGAAAVPEAASLADAMTARELQATLDEELDRLPPRYREPLVLCYLEGLTRDEAAARLGVPEATLKSQLERGRKRLAAALTARGCGLGVALLAAAATSPAGASPPRLLQSILAAAGGAPSPPVAALAREVAVGGILTRTRLVMLAAAAVAAGLGVAAVPTEAGPQKPADKMDKPAARAAKPDAAKAAAERTISGTVLGPDGAPAPADLKLVWQEGKPQPLGRTRDDGTFSLTVPLKRGDYGGWLVATAPGCGPDFHPHGIDYLPQSLATTTGLTFRLPKERPVRGRLIDERGKPVAGAAVVASYFSAFDSDASMAAHLKNWATETYPRGTPPHGDRGMYFSDGYRERKNPDGRSPYTAVTDKDGRFAVAGAGANQLVILRIRAAGMADKELVTLNRDGFDPEPTNALTRTLEFKEFGGKWVLYGPDPAVVLETEKIIRGTVTDHRGNPRVGVRVTFSRPNKRDLNPDENQAVTDKDGRYEIRGARKHPGYMVEVPPDPAAGLLPCQGFADDTVGYEPIRIDLKCAKGVVLTGTVKNKATGEPVHAQVYTAVLANNPFVEKYPPFMHAASYESRSRTDKDGKFRIVIIPGPVLVSVGPSKGNWRDYKTMVPDPKYPGFFHPLEGALEYDDYGGGRGIVQGNWCKVFDAKPADEEVTVAVELEPSTRTLVKVVDADGKPVSGLKATGVEVLEFTYATDFPGDTLTVYDVPPEKPRLVAVTHPKRRLVGTAKVTADEKAPVIKLGPGGTVTGRAVDPAGKPLAGLSVHLYFTGRPVHEAFKTIAAPEAPVTDANGEFRIDALFPGQDFKVMFQAGKKRYGLDYRKTPVNSVSKHGDTLKLGDLELEPTMTDGE